MRDVERGTDWASLKRQFVKLDVMCCTVQIADAVAGSPCMGFGARALDNSKVAS